MTFYDFAKAVMSVPFRIMGWKIKGLENLPAEGPVILASNHVSLWDPVLLGCGVPRQVWYMAKDELFHVPLFGWVLKHLGAFPVKRGQGDTSAIRQSLAILKEQRVLGVFPEGTRSKTGQLQKALPGIVLFMEKSQAPIVPVRVCGTRKLFSQGWGKVGIVIGKPLTPEMLKPPAGVENRREWVAQKIMEALERLPEI